MTVPDGAAFNLSVSAGTGSASFDLPDDAAIRFEASVGTGKLQLPAWLRPTGTDDVWQTDHFDGAARQIVIHYQGGSGNLAVR